MEGETREDIDTLIDRLRQIQLKYDEKNDEDLNIIEVLDTFGCIGNISIQDDSNVEIDDIFLKLLHNESSKIVAKTAKAIAEIAKTDRGREKCTDSKLTEKLMELLKRDDIEVVTQATRALSNICYENEKGNKMVQQNNGLSQILTILQRSVNLNGTEGAALLRTTAAGFLLNFLVDQSSLQEKALKADVIPIICSVLEVDGTNNDGKAAMHALLTLGLFNDSGNQFLDERLCKILVDILAKPVLSELSEMCLELVHGQAENENAKLLFAKTGFCELLLQLIEKYGPRCTDEETRSILKVACNLIVLILTGDESMNLLYDGSNGKVYKKLVEWLDSTDEDLQVTAILAMGNFASTDAHCQLMVEQGIHRKLLQLLGDDVGKNGGIRFQHALLSALRNLVIPASNKPIVLADGLVDVVYPMLEIPTFPVVFKLLGTLRIVIQGQQEAAILLGKRDDLVKKAVAWCATEDDAGVQGEANRLIAWLVIHSRDKEVVAKIIKYGGVEHLVKMITAQHALMQNEALMSLSILSAISLIESEEALIQAEVGQALVQFFEQKDPQPDPALTSNALTLTSNLLKSKSEVLIEQLQKSVGRVCERGSIVIATEPTTA
ncbi:rap1 GTPase-GDP dissociation stimulator 1-B [Venturia canescens]|uniref:rap1 GTPase-GDP dissociation stimulator 1-B n=1 Tax=Venturia canescens TaxID=32260 RepID=UPI001C9C62E1|nr:rap1 GTPase-GDP dissociation stimulator 1-B [Venturia canescens]